jgi:hypothetical protein
MKHNIRNLAFTAFAVSLPILFSRSFASSRQASTQTSNTGELSFSGNRARSATAFDRAKPRLARLCKEFHAQARGSLRKRYGK